MNSKVTLFNILETLTAFFQSIDSEYNENDTSEKLERVIVSSVGGTTLDLQKRILALNASLKFPERGPLLNAALSVMGYEGHKILHGDVVFFVETIASLLESTITCKVSSELQCPSEKDMEIERRKNHYMSRATRQRYQSSPTIDVNCKWQYSFQRKNLDVGSCISITEFSKIVDACQMILGNIQGFGDLFKLLIDSLFRVAISIPSFQKQFFSSSSFYKRNTREKLSHRELVALFVKKAGTLKNSLNLPLRLYAWRLHPYLLKEDMSSVLFVAVQRPLLNLKREFHKSDFWHSMVVSFAAAPDTFSEARCILHHWFLQTGIERVWQLRTELVSTVLDALSGPNFWGIPSDIGLKLPSSHAFFPQRLQPLLSLLTGPITYKNLLSIVCTLEEMQTSGKIYPSHSTKSMLEGSQYYGHYGASSSNIGTDTFFLMDDNSIWSVLLDFPSWFMFAAVLLFHPDTTELSEVDNDDSTLFYKNYLVKDCDQGGLGDHFRYYLAAKFLAWVLSPLDTSHRNLVVISLLNLAEDWNSWQTKLMNSNCQDAVKGIHGLESDVNRKRDPVLFETDGSILHPKCKKAKINNDHMELEQNYLRLLGHHNENAEGFHAVIIWLYNFCCQYHKLWESLLRNSKADVDNTTTNFGDLCEWKNHQGNEFKCASSQQVDSGACTKQYAYLRRIPIGLLLSNAFLLCEDTAKLILYFVTAAENLRVIQSSLQVTYHEYKRSQVNAQGIHDFINQGHGDRYAFCSERPYYIEGFEETIFQLCERNANWVKNAAFALNVIEMLTPSSNLLGNTGTSEVMLSPVRGTFLNFLVTCTKRLLERKDSQDLTLLKDLHLRLSDLSQAEEISCLSGNVLEDVLKLLDSKISAQNA